MAREFLVVDQLKDWGPFYPSDDVITFNDYLAREETDKGRARVINLCRNYRYLREGYYCSLLAEARGHHVIPSVKTLNDLRRKDLISIQQGELTPLLQKAYKQRPAETQGEFKVFAHFGDLHETWLQELARRIFERFPCPILELSLRLGERLELLAIKPRSPRELSDQEQTRFAEGLERFSRKIWRSPKAQKRYRYDLAILVDPDEPFPPSDERALKRLIKASRAEGMDAELITRRDLGRLAEFDALFIRATTNVDHYTYRFAKKAEAEGMVVIDDPTSILRCTNKIYLADMFKRFKVPAPKTRLLRKDALDRLDEVESELGYPIVLKIPDGSFSRGVVKVGDRQALLDKANELFKESALLLAQEFLYTPYDWRIGVLDGKPLYACKYDMVRDHWQIYRHGGKGTDSGGFATMPTYEVPKAILDAAVKATRAIGNGLYGVDVKQADKRVAVIEVNDNPNLDAGVEDKFLGEALYTELVKSFIRRIER